MVTQATQPTTTPEQDFTKESIARLRLGLKKKGEGKEITFPLSVFPAHTQAFIKAYCDCYGSDPSHYGLSVLTTAGAAIGNSLHIKDRGQSHPPIIFGILVARPSSGKTPIMKKVMEPVWTLESKYNQQYKEACAAVVGTDTPVPPRKEIVLNDTTTEAVFNVLYSNSRGILYYVDEVTKLFGSIGRYSKGGGNSDEAFFLEVFTGGNHKKSRSKDETGPKMIFDIFMSILGSTQPGILSSLLSGNKSLNGFLARFLFAYPSPIPKTGYHNNTPDPKHDIAWDKIINTLYDIPFTPALFEEHPSPHIVHLSPGAKQSYMDFFDRNAKEATETDDEIIEGILGKFDTYVLRLALILEALRFSESIYSHYLATAIDTPVTTELRDAITISQASMDGAIQLQRYFRHTALKVVNRLSGPYESLPDAQREWYLSLPDDDFRRESAHTIGQEAKISPATIDRLLRRQDLFKKHRQGMYSKVY